MPTRRPTRPAFPATADMSVAVTEAAALKIQDIMKAEELVNQFLRFKVRGGGCAGFEHDLYFDDQAGELDEIFESNGVKVVIDPLSLQYLDGSTIDVVEGVFGPSFKITNPNATGLCGCGNSFSA